MHDISKILTKAKLQVWILEQLQVGPNMWTLKNFKTGMYLYLDYNGAAGQTKIPIIVRSASPLDENAQWNITPVQQQLTNYNVLEYYINV